jgi:hypothetical protein
LTERSTVTVERDDSGRVVAVRRVTEHDPAWLPEDTEAVLEWADFQSSLCGGCGLPVSTSMDPAMDGRFEAVPLQCFACAAKDAETRDASEQVNGKRMAARALDGVYITVKEKGA